MVRHEEYDFHAFKESNDICQNCLCWKDFKEKCWYHWNLKKECSQKIKAFPEK